MITDPNVDNRKHYYGLSAGHGKHVGMKIYDTDMRNVIGEVTKVWNETSPTCDAALFYMGADLHLSNSIFSGVIQQRTHLEKLPRDPKENDIIFKFCDRNTEMSDVLGTVEYIGFYYKEEPFINDCIVIKNIEDIRKPFSREGDSGMVVAALSEHRGGPMLVTGLAVIIAVDRFTTIDRNQRQLTIVQPLSRVMTTIRKDPLYQLMEIVSVGVNMNVTGKHGCCKVTLECLMYGVGSLELSKSGVQAYV